MNRPLTLVVAFVLVPLATAQEKTDPPKKDELKLSKDEQGVIDLTNAERKKAELPPLKVNAKLMVVARAHAANMAKQEKFEHTLDEKDPTDRVKDAGYKYRLTGENILWNAGSPKVAIEAWMDSEVHRANILHKDFTEIGVGMAKSEKGEPYWVQVFGAPPE